MQSLASLQTLRAQFEAASQRWPSIRHSMSFILDTPSNRCQLMRDRNSLDGFISGGSGVFAQHRINRHGVTPSVLWTYGLTTNDQANRDGRAAERYKDLAASAWTIISHNWPALIQHAACPHKSNADAGVEARAWIGDYWKFVQREAVLAQHEELRSRHFNLDWDDLYVPDNDQWRLVGLTHSHPEDLWMLIVHNLAWRAGKGGPLQANRYTWVGDMDVEFDTLDDLRRFDGVGPIPKVSLPLEWFGSRLRGDVFLASIWAIDSIVKLVDSSTPGPESAVKEIPWKSISDEQFERLIYSIFVHAPGYENPKWLTHTRAPDAGRDMSVTKVISDSLGFTQRRQVIVQCKHWTSKSVAPEHVEHLLSRRSLWEPPAVDELIIVTSGRFTSDAAKVIENRNAGNDRLHIIPWAGSDIERMVSTFPNLREIVD